MQLFATAAVPAADIVRQLPMPAPFYGAIAFCGFLLLLGVLWMFRGAATKYGQQQENRARAGAARRAAGQDAHGAPH